MRVGSQKKMAEKQETLHKKFEFQKIKPSPPLMLASLIYHQLCFILYLCLESGYFVRHFTPMHMAGVE
jgi:hypothetical protein